MTDQEKLEIILAATNDGADLQEHQKILIKSAFLDTLGSNTGVRMVFEDLYEQYKDGSKNATDDGDNP